jgi:hypothetical protein
MHSMPDAEMALINRRLSTTKALTLQVYEISKK